MAEIHIEKTDEHGGRDYASAIPTVNQIIGPRLTALIARAPIFIGMGGLLTLAGLFASPRSFFQSYLFAYMFWFGITLGSTAWLMAHHVTGGGWGFLLRRPLEAATRVWPLTLALFVPLAIAMFLSMRDGHALGALYHWADPHVVAGDAVLQKKLAYLNPLAWLLRAGVCFLIWFGLSYLLNKWSREEDVSNSPEPRHKLSMWSGLGLVVFLITVTIASVDWVMTIEPHWYSALWGAIFLVGEGLATLSIMVVLIYNMMKGTALFEKIETRYFRDIGNLMLAFTIFWAYTNYSQFMIQYSGNLAEEATWQLHRTTHGWQFFGAVNIVLHFALPFLFALMSITKVNMGNLRKLAMFLIFARFVDLFFYVVPTFRVAPGDGLPIPGATYPFAFLADLGLPILLGGLWIWAWASQMKKTNAPLVPAYDERIGDDAWPLGAAEATVGSTGLPLKEATING